jgi:hypothetical protein
MFKADRTFSIKNEKTGLPEWYFQAREGNAGPFESKQEAQVALKEFIKACIATGNTGGREPNGAESTQKTAQLKNQTVFNFGLKGKIHWY